MSRIQALDEITSRLGPPALLRWVDAPYGAAAAVVRLRHRGGAVDCSASGAFRLIFQLSSSQVMRGGAEAPGSRDVVRAGSVVPFFAEQPERIRIFGSADTLQLLFSSELADACGPDRVQRLHRVHCALQAIAAQTLVAASLDGTDAQLEQAVAAVARLVAERHTDDLTAGGGLAPFARRAMLELLEKRIGDGVSVAELADAANLSLHHFIKVCRQSEGLTPHALLMQKRVERSIELLLDRGAAVDEVAMLTGFSSPSHFISTFRRLIGVTPASLRRAARC